MKVISILLCVFLTFSLPASGQSFPKGIKYLGGPGFSPEKGVRKSWDNSLALTEKEITFGFRKDLHPPETIPVSSVKRLTYGQATTRRVGKWIAVGVLVAPIALVGIFHKSRQHRILIEWTDEQKHERGMLMQAHKNQFEEILNALTYRTGKPLYATAKDKEWLFKRGVNAEVDEEAAEKAGKKKKK